MEAASLTVETRTKPGKEGSAKLRRAGRIPAVVYGTDAPPAAIAVDEAAFAKLLRGERPALLSLKSNDGGGAKEELAVLKAVQRHPVNERIVHLDFLRVAADKPLTVDVPVRVEGIAAGIKFGGVIQQPVRHVRVRCLPAAIPDAAIADITPMEIGHVLTAGNLKLPPGVTLLTEPGQAVISIIVVKYEEETAEAAPAEGAAAEGADAPAQPEVIGEKEREERRLKKDEDKGKRETEKAEVKETQKEKKK